MGLVDAAIVHSQALFLMRPHYIFMVTLKSICLQIFKL
jgi:hypothetical protein